MINSSYEKINFVYFYSTFFKYVIYVLYGNILLITDNLLKAKPKAGKRAD